MSEYQYYEFTAVDRPLTPQQQAELRNRSSRATITATSFINEYHWGNLKGDPLDWMQRYFDAHVYSANWGSCSLMIRLPIPSLDSETLKQFTALSQTDTHSFFVEAFAVTQVADQWILQWNFNDDSGSHERFWSQEDGPGWMASLLPVRDELMRGDIRSLYLGWLARVCNGEIGGDDLEPPIPPGLQSLTPAQTALTEFLLIDPDWLAAAATVSQVLPDCNNNDSDIDNWIANQSVDDMRATLRLLLERRGQEAERQLQQRFLNWQREHLPNSPIPRRRTVAEIDAQRDAARIKRLEHERQQQAAEEAKRLAERKLQLERLAANSESAWVIIDRTLQRGSGLAYDQALKALIDLSEALKQAERKDDLRRGLVKLQSVHGKRGAWVKRLVNAGIIDPDKI
jgi:hypothetical protein